MNLIKLLLVAIVFVVNVAIARPALADRPPLAQNPDYVSLTDALTKLTQALTTDPLPEGLTRSDIQQEINSLQYQKYIMETGKDTVCRNETTQPIAVYGDKPRKSTSTFDEVIYLLPAGEETDDDWSCKGVYLPNDVKVAGLTVDSAAAVKVLQGTQLVLTEDPDTGAIAFNLPPKTVLKAGDANWEIPDLTHAQLTTQFPAAPLD
jgi:hypothetical protein